MSVITVGNFDGVHLGHQLLLKRVAAIAKKNGTKSIAVTFQKHPKSKVITNNTEKKNLISSCEIDEVIFLDFNEFSSMSGENFLQYLKDNFFLSTFVCGRDFRFGKDALCDVDFLSNQKDFTLDIIDFEEEKISSSKIREYIENGDVENAEALLGYRFSISSPISGGKQLGRKLGFPTVNSTLSEDIILLKFGVYATDIILGEKSYRAISNVGIRPTVEKTDKPNIETYILNKEVEVTSKSAKVVFKKFIRSEKKFSSYEELVSQISKDCQIAEKIV